MALNWTLSTRPRGKKKYGDFRFLRFSTTASFSKLFFCNFFSVLLATYPCRDMMVNNLLYLSFNYHLFFLRKVVLQQYPKPSSINKIYRNRN